jgi:hypothetical protein
MKKFIFPTSIMVILVLFHFSCQFDIDKDDPIINEPNLTGLEGNWIAIKVEFQNDDISEDISEYIKEFKIDISKNQSSCNINGCTSWTTTKAWEKSGNFYCNYFKNQDTDCIMFFNILSIKGSYMTAEIRNNTPTIKFLSEESSNGNYIVSFVPE